MRIVVFLLRPHLALALLGAGPLQSQNQPAATQARFDVVVTGGRIMDGTGNPWILADVAIRDGRIVALGRLDGARGARVLDAKGKLVVPGFIDVHNHADDDVDPAGTLRDPNARRRAAPNVVMQGVTTVVVNPDGRSPGRIADQQTSMVQKGIGPNAVLMIGHNSVRSAVLGPDYRRLATPDEIRRMRILVRQGIEEGALGLSAGLEYVPGRWSNTEELVALMEEVAPLGGIYIAHERSEAMAPMWWKPTRDASGPPTLLDAVRETIEIGERTGAVVVASHLKSRGASYWGSSHAAINLIERARARGVQIYADHYPYTTSGSDGSVVLVPDWAIGYAQWDAGPRSTGGSPDYAATLRRTLADPVKGADAKRDIAFEIEFRGGPENIVVFESRDTTQIGKSLAALAEARGKTAVEMAIVLQIEGFPHRPGGARLRSFSMSEADIEAFAKPSWMATASDGGLALPPDGPTVHARYYGTFPRKIRRYALDRGVISLEHAIRSMTSLPAQILGLRDRGTLREGAAADIAILDLDRLTDKATFTNPHQYAEGVDYVLVNGQLVVDGGQPTWKLPGTVLRKPVRPGSGKAIP